MKKIMLSLFTSLILALGFSSCTNPGTASFSDVDKAAITKVATDVNQAFNKTKDFKAYVTSYYAEDATILYPNSDAIKGRDAITADISRFGTDFNVTPTLVDINGSDSLAYVHGTVKMSTNAGVELDRGKYIEIWKKQKDGKWQVFYDIYNTSVPMAADSVMTK